MPTDTSIQCDLLQPICLLTSNWIASADSSWLFIGWARPPPPPPLSSKNIGGGTGLPVPTPLTFINQMRTYFQKYTNHQASDHTALFQCTTSWSIVLSNAQTNTKL